MTLAPSNCGSRANPPVVVLDRGVLVVPKRVIACVPPGHVQVFNHLNYQCSLILPLWHPRCIVSPDMTTTLSGPTSSTLEIGLGYASGGRDGAEPRVSVACLEASYATGLGWSDATGEPSTEALVHGAADATLTAVKRLDGRPARLVLVVETAERHARLGSAAREEWAAIRGQLDESTPCGGWLVNDVAAYGRGVQPVAAPGALVVVAVGDSPRGESSRG